MIKIRFISLTLLEGYPQIILHKKGQPYESYFNHVNSGYVGALMMTILEEQIHSIQTNLQEINKQAVSEVNAINEELAKIILDLDNTTVNKLSEYLQIPPIPEEFPIARRANLFFVLNPDTFIVQVLGPDVMTFTKVTVDPKISEMIPQLLDIYQRWLKPIQIHHAAFTTMEGMAEFAVKNILQLVTYVSDPRHSLVEKCLKLAQTFGHPNLSITEYVDKLNSMGEALRNLISDVKNPTRLISILNEYMFDTLGFSGNYDDYYNPDNNFLNVVIDNKVGIPITLSIIYIDIAGHIGLNLRPVGFPSHFLVKHTEEMIIDPFGRGRLLTIDYLHEILTK